MRGREQAQENQAYKLNRLIQGYQWQYQNAKKQYLGMLQNDPALAAKIGELNSKTITPERKAELSKDPDVVAAQQASAGADSAWAAMQKIYGNYIDPQKKTKSGKSSKSKGGDQSSDQSNPIQMAQSQDPQEKAKGLYQIWSRIGPDYKIDERYLTGSQYQQQQKIAQGQRTLQQGQTDDQIALRQAEMEDTSKMKPEEKEAHDQKVYALKSRLSGVDKEMEESAQVRGMKSGLKAAGLDDEAIKKVISAHYGGVGMRGSTIQQKYADAVQEAIDKGQDPTTYPPAVELAQSISAEHPSASRAVTLQLPDGKKTAGKVDHEGNLLLEDGTKAPEGSMLYQQPNYASQMAGTKTINVIDDTGIPRIMGWNPQTKQYDIPQGVSAAGAYGHEMEQAGAVTRGGQALIADINANKEKLGTLLAWVKKHGINAPYVGDPVLAHLQSELKTFAALQPAMHGFRSRSAQEAFENIIGDVQKNPEATIASIQGILGTAKAINPTLGGDTSTQTPKKKRNPSQPVVDPNDPGDILGTSK